MSLGTYFNCQGWGRSFPCPGYSFVSEKIEGDEVGKALEECERRAKEELGSKTPTMVEWFWQPEWVGTVWRA